AGGGPGRGDLVGRPGPGRQSAPGDAVPDRPAGRGRGPGRPGPQGRIGGPTGPSEHHQSRHNRLVTNPGTPPRPRRPPPPPHPHRTILLLPPRPASPDRLAHLTTWISFPSLAGEQLFPARLRPQSEPGGTVSSRSGRLRPPATNRSHCQ